MKKLRSHITNTPLVKRPYVGRHRRDMAGEVIIKQVFLDADLRFALPGLLELCRKHRIKVTDHPIGNLIVFVNTSRSQIKAIACNGTPDPVLTAYPIPSHFPRGHKFDLGVIEQIPRALGNSGYIDIAEAMRASLLKKLRGSSIVPSSGWSKAKPGTDGVAAR